MIRALSTFLICVVSLIRTFAQGDSLQARIVLIGDAGALKKGHHPVISAIREKIKFDGKTTILYLGDNLYLTGLPDQSVKTYAEARAVLDTQIFIAPKATGTKVYFIPGNHDWNRGSRYGYESILREQEYINQKSDLNVRFYPEDGCGGPVEVPVSKDVVMILFDSQWWIHRYEKPGIESDCPFKTKTEILSQMDDILTRNSEKLVILACHHPFRSFGTHGGYFKLKQYFFPLTEMWPNFYLPLPGIGLIYPIARGVFGTPQDLKHPAYANMIKDVEKVVKQHRNVIFVAGHEHNLQYIKDGNFNYIISGAGTKSTRVSKNKKAPFTASDNGFALLEVSKNKNVDLSFYTVKDTIGRPFHEPIMNFAKIAIEKSDTTTDVVSLPQSTPLKDSVIVVANASYDTASRVHRFILGNNYRKDWATPVQLKVFNLNKEKGGFIPKELGGGKQTQSLRLEDKQGRSWTLRTINKDPEKAIPENLRGSLASKIVQDMISASNPYAPLTVPTLSKAVGVIAPEPEFFFVPDDPAFGKYRETFANKVCLLEEREPGSKPGDTKSTAKVIQKIVDDNDNHVEQQLILKARLLDLLIGDWDRHLDQWRFGTHDTGKGKLYYAIPRDRDQAYFNSDGLLLKAVSANIMPYLRGFKNDLKRINWLSWEARDFDRLFLNGLSENDWRSTLDTFKNELTDAVITQAVQKLPKEIFAIDGQKIIDKLKVRRDALVNKEGINYYKFLSKEVSIIGSNKKEYFKVSKAEGGVQVRVYKRTHKSDSTALMYNRVFKDKQTKELRLYGLNDNDVFVVDPDVDSKIFMRIIGGRGNDTFSVNGKMKNFIYDLRSEQNSIVNGSHSKNKMLDYPSANEYDYTGYKYNIYRFPQIDIGYNAEDKLMVGLGFLKRTFGFRNEPFATQQKLSSLYAPASGSYRIRYNGEFNHLFGTTDLVASAEMYHPVLNNFFGIGNNTTQNFNPEFYRVRYNYIKADLLLRRRLGGVIQVMAGPTFYNYWNKPNDNKNKILSRPSLVGLDSARVYTTQTFGGVRGALVINTVNNGLFPTRGIYWNTELSSVYGMNKNTNHYAAFTSDLTLYSSLRDPVKLIAVIRGGGGKILSDKYEYFQLLNLGSNNYLRGFRKNRFSGTSLLYGSVELRQKLFESKSYILPGAFGLIGFEEVGKVWTRTETSKKWHNSFGGGFYFSPYNLVLVSATLGFSDEEKLFNFSIGTKFNITF